MTQKQIIINHLKDHKDWLPSYKLRGTPTRYGFIGHQGDRRARELVEEGKLERKDHGKYAYYRFPKEIPTIVI